MLTQNAAAAGPPPISGWVGVTGRRAPSGLRSAIELLQPAPSAAFRRRGPIDLVRWHEQVLDRELRNEMLVVQELIQDEWDEVLRGWRDGVHREVGDRVHHGERLAQVLFHARRTEVLQVLWLLEVDVPFVEH